MKTLQTIGKKFLIIMEDVGLLIIAIATLIAVGMEVLSMLEKRTVALEDLLLLFIYLEVLAMISIYLQSGKLPIRIPLYIAIVALARYLILDMKNMDTWRMLAVSGAALLLATAVLIIRFGQFAFLMKKTIVIK